MRDYYYSPYTGELIHTDSPADWMGRTQLAPPAHDPAIESAVFRDGAWVLVCPEPEPVLVPRAVTRFQARAALHLAGLLPQVEALMTHPDTPMLARLAWADALEFRRESETVAAMSAALGLSGEQIDALFVAAAGIEA